MNPLLQIVIVTVNYCMFGVFPPVSMPTVKAHYCFDSRESETGDTNKLVHSKISRVTTVLGEGSRKRRVQEWVWQTLVHSIRLNQQTQDC
ncbi:hypothetical protein FRX31_013234 [Thalictrum thalictroides]|uniref:Uncharacterized protein n=1 Tax=Thalictrum thalictroides TaxID=46969 RepID=A0A7J6WII8_THATH|nr:hypothetical protein FRX31_013234 [Thalictrum thalictroides]